MDGDEANSSHRYGGGNLRASFGIYRNTFKIAISCFSDLLQGTACLDIIGRIAEVLINCSI